MTVANNADSYNWNYVNGLSLLPSGNSCLITGNRVGNYTLHMSSNNTCGKSGDRTVSVVVSSTGVKCAQRSMTTDFKSDELKIYPNPANDNVTISLDETYIVTIFNSLGEKVSSVKGQGTTNVDASTLSSGMYFFQIETQTESYRRKILISK